jgi:hypothetical protein
MRHLSGLAWLAVLASAGAGCGARTGLLLPSLEGGTEAVDAAPDTSCEQSPISIEPNVPNLYFVLDVSSSMSEDMKWTNVRTVVGQLITQLGASAKFGATVFPAQGTGDVCSAGAEVMPLRSGDAQGATARAFLEATNFPPHGGTPTAATLEGLTKELSALRGPTFVILATDGGPNCNSALTCDLSTCTSNIDDGPGCPPAGPSCCIPGVAAGLGCLDGARTVTAVSALDALGIETFVLGIPGSAPYAAVLDSVAVAGGTARTVEPLYYRADDADPTTLAAVLADIAAQTMASCTFALAQAPKDPGAVNVQIDGAVVPEEGPDGWALSGAQLTLRGASCRAVQGTATPSPLSVVEGCPTVTQ